MNNDMTVALGRQIRTERFLRGFSQEQLAETAGLHRTFIGVVERGEKNITVSNCSKIANALDIRLSELIRMAEETLTHSRVNSENSPAG
jgi:transcriptional regulator with XRE-family HTH domain